MMVQLIIYSSKVKMRYNANIYFIRLTSSRLLRHYNIYIYKFCVCVCVCVCTECPGGNMPDFGRMFLTLNYTDITQNTFVYPKLNGYGDNGERSLKV